MGGVDDLGRAANAEAREQLLSLFRAYRIAQAVYVVARLGIPDLLINGPREVDDLAQATGSHSPSLKRVLLALAAVGVLDKVGPRRFALTPIGAMLRADVPNSLRPSVLFSLNESHWRPWGHLLHTVRTGETAFEHVHGANLFDYMAAHPEVASLFNSGMLGNSPAHARLIATMYDFSQKRLVVDVGAGRGRLLATILECHRHLRGILFDLPHVIDDARRLVNDAGVSDRCEFVGGNFFEAVPAGGDAYVFRNIIHDWQDDQAVAILKTCRHAVGDSAHLILVERYLADDPREALLIHHADLEMLVNVGGLERTSDEYATLLERSGFRLFRTISLGNSREAMGHYLVEAHPV
jgi:hypothetical protein